MKDALDLAILIEEEARDRYDEFYDNLAVHHTADAGHKPSIESCWQLAEGPAAAGGGVDAVG